MANNPKRLLNSSYYLKVFQNALIKRLKLDRKQKAIIPFVKKTGMQQFYLKLGCNNLPNEELVFKILSRKKLALQELFKNKTILASVK